jgi:heat shock protein HtpX
MCHVNEESRDQEYSKNRRRISFLGGVIFISAATAFILISTQVFGADWKEWWVGAGGLLVGFGVALGASVMMDYGAGREYELINSSLWEYVLVRFRFLFVLFMIPMALTIVVGAFVTTYYRGPFVWSILLLRGMTFMVLIVFAGFLLPDLFGKITGAEGVGQQTHAMVNNIAAKMGVTIQGVYRVPLEDLRRANAVQIGFIEGKKVVFLLGSWEKHFTKDEIGAVLAHEFAHARHNHIRKLLIAQLLCRLGVPGLIFLSIDFAMTVLRIPKPAPPVVILAFVGPALVLLLGSILLPAWLSRKYETEADLQAAEAYGADAMISALRRLAQLNLVPEERSHLLSTHPSFGDRIRALSRS